MPASALAHAEPSERTVQWWENYLATLIAISTFGGSITFSLIISDIANPARLNPEDPDDITPTSQRTTDVKAIETGEKTGVRTYIIMPPLIYRRGTGFFNQRSQQIPMLIRKAIKAGRAEYIAPGTVPIDHVHVADFTVLFEAVLARALTDDQLPSGRNGYFFAEAGSHA
ncbi:uncharacterized protein DNG_09499 [Cephalotrichum gorgonifer]|uniref:NAD-dependent epimerase/dehydratase domain-containing protein n=1 Tax=Cephalotrichum gorgonifer TaxID=2041049 RepID=A0AAE8N8G9_9PEZI|nr:uncharacterized protein DNG_09499 [Cephalotrichum gorgonifer]